VRFLSEEEIDILSNTKIISDVLNFEEIRANEHFITNIGVFRKYVFNYLKNHSMIRDNLTLLVRQLNPCEFGVPLQIYAFAKTTIWDEYEEIQSSVVEHIISVSGIFFLRLYQNPTGYDIINVMSAKKP
jgi:miniconductance mechanosensitive channel